MGATTAGITGGSPREMTPAARATIVTERIYGRSPTIMDVHPGNAADAWSAYIAFAWPTLHVLAECWTNNLDIQLSADGGSTYEDVKEIENSRAELIPFTATGFRVRNSTAGSTSRYQVTGVGTGF